MLPPGADLDMVRRMGDAGVHRVLAAPTAVNGDPTTTAGDPHAAIQRLADSIISRL